ncbi:hypothetical protein [Pseudobacteriovorax antillogorgiicola]|uniref:Uncharacterized protein n=1 Tax=Pseudobacteriovorax antillogorgiicola TaxID=1513793 RepID=A0A1Y6BET3_9BACT|nr:hypothetical protein [Pseudobacteriovorax antillogorgiicola]TCS56283.1 hypothetical protein EDD56_104105 [Pseudobacteriovorax antillogorgiicola]SMF07643.1 hypothetical protein SAMN06296036_104228 [Pseudobacteriovorax antillogorgiicola]
MLRSISILMMLVSCKSMNFKARNLDDQVLPMLGSMALYEEALGEVCYTYGENLVQNSGFETPAIDDDWALVESQGRVNFHWLVSADTSIPKQCGRQKPAVELSYQDQGSQVNQVIHLWANCQEPRFYLKEPIPKTYRYQVKLAQSVTTERGSQYFIEFDYKYDGATDQRFLPRMTVKFGSHTISSVLEKNGWQKFSRLVRANSTKSEFEISVKEPLGQLAIDNVTIRRYAGCQKRRRHCRKIKTVVDFDPGYPLKRPKVLANRLLRNGQGIELGSGGTIVLKMDQPVFNQPGYEFLVEAPRPQDWPASVLVSQWPDGPWNFVGYVRQASEFDLNPIQSVSYIRIEDHSQSKDSEYRGFHLKNTTCL